jgi:hypothetical protein
VVSAPHTQGDNRVSEGAYQRNDQGHGRCSPKPSVRSTVTAVQFDTLLPFDAWREVGIKIARFANSSRWWLGDWLLFGRHKYGSRYREAIAATGLDYQTLRNYAVVARRFEPPRRRDTLSFQHHAEVCALDDQAQDQWLDHAAAGGWSRGELRRRMRRTTLALHATHPGSSRLELSADRAERWRLAAQKSAVDLDVWIQETLDRAADAILAGGP